MLGPDFTTEFFLHPIWAGSDLNKFHSTGALAGALAGPRQ